MSKSSIQRTRRARLVGFEALEDRRVLATFTVDDSFAGDNPAQRRYDTIQEAVNAAVAGDIVRVKAGTYEENVVVNKRLRILGADPKLSHANDPNKASIVDPVDDGVGGVPAYGFDLQAADIEIKGFTIGEFDAATDADGTVGIKTSELFSGYRIEDNVIENNNFGIYLNTSTAANAKKTTVEDNVIRNNNNGVAVPLAAAGNGIYSDQGARNVKIEENTFNGHQNEDIIFVAPTAVQTKITIEENKLKDSSGIFLKRVSDSKIEENEITRSLFNAIELAGGNTKVTIEENKLKDVGTEGYNGIFLHDNDLIGANTNNKIKENKITNAGLSGIVIRNSSLNTISKNTVTGSIGFDLSDPNWGNGIALENATNNTVKDNKIKKNARHGFFADATSIDNLIDDNLSVDNATGDPAAQDYHDDSVGAGTGGTGNTYDDNRGETESPPGLIEDFV